MALRSRLSYRRLVCLTAWSTMGCGGSPTNSGFALGPPQDAGGADAIMETDATVPSGDGDGRGATVDDGGQLFSTNGTTLAACVPGTYVGTFDCTISAILGLVQIPWKGPISLTLTGRQSGGEVQTLTIAPGARISGTDQYDGSFSANLSGTLDCPTQKLTGALDGDYQLAMGIVNVNAMFAGDMGADYTGSSTTPAFTNGVMGPLASPQWGGDGGFLGTCKWSAALR
jgi:hypothetical protein